MRDNNINCTAHAGESFGPDSVHQAIHKCGAHRIGHGTRLVENGDLLNYVNDHRIPLEVWGGSMVFSLFPLLIWTVLALTPDRFDPLLPKGAKVLLGGRSVISIYNPYFFRTSFGTPSHLPGVFPL